MKYTMKAGEGSSTGPAPARSVVAQEEAIRDLVKWLEMSWNSGASAGFATAFAEDADFVTVLGMHHTGRSAIEAGHRHLFDTTYKGSRTAYIVEKIRSVGPEVAIVFLRQRLELRDAKVLEARPTLTMVRNGERWHIAVLQNTLVAEKPRNS